jgi:hypothetical protein
MEPTALMVLGDKAWADSESRQEPRQSASPARDRPQSDGTDLDDHAGKHGRLGAGAPPDRAGQGRAGARGHRSVPGTPGRHWRPPSSVGGMVRA